MSNYTTRMNRVLDFIENNIAEELTLGDLASEACFSPYHFLRIFHSYTGERPFQFIQRVRLEKAAGLLVARRDLKILDIALTCGFSNAPAFSRAFKEKFEISPSIWRKERKEFRNLSTVDSKHSEEVSSWVSYIEYHQGVQLWRMKKDQQERRVEVKQLESKELVYVRYTGPYKGDASLFQRLWNRLCREAGAHDLIEEDSMYLSLYHDNPDLTRDDQLRVTVALSTTKEVPGTSSLGKMTLPGGKYAFAHFLLNSQEYQQAWDWVYCEWLPQSGYWPDDKPSFELYPLNEEKREDHRYPVIICIPLVAAH